MNLIERIAVNVIRSNVPLRYKIAKAISSKIGKAGEFMKQDISKAQTLPFIKSPKVKEILKKGVDVGTKKAESGLKMAAANPDVAAVYGTQALISNVIGPATGNPWTLAIPASGVTAAYAAGKKGNKNIC